MNSYKCVVYDSKKKRKTITLNLQSKDEIINYANLNGMKVVSIKSENKLLSRKKMKDKELRVFCKEIGILLESGCEITGLLEILKKQSNKDDYNLISQIQSYINRGNLITESFLNTSLFSKFFISMMRTGEVSGNLDSIMNNLSEYYDKEYKLKSKVKNILIYPAFLIVATIAVATFMLINIIPNFYNNFINNGINPPLLTTILMNISNFLKHNFLYLILGIILLITSVFYLVKNNSQFKYKIDKLKFRIPGLKNISILVMTTQFSRALYILNSSGVHIIESVEIASRVVDNQYIYDKMTVAIEYIKKGNSIGESLTLINIFPNLFISMISIGEQVGRLDNSLNTINKFYESELNENVEVYVQWLGPIITVAIGIVVGTLIISMIIPIFDMVQSIQ